MKNFLIIIALTFSILSFSKEDYIYAINNTEYLNSQIVYNIDKGGIQEFNTTNETGEEVILSIEHNASNSRSVGNGTYNITATTSQWKAGYQIAVQNHSIVSVQNGYHTAYTGSFVSARLARDSSKQATYYLNRKLGLVRYSINLSAKLLSNTISVSY